MFDCHTRAMPCQSAIDEMSLFFTKQVGKEEEKSLCEDIFQFVGAPKDASFHLTASGAEAIHQVLFSVFMERAKKEGKTHFLTTCTEDAPTLQALKRCEEFGCTVRLVPVNANGQIDLDQLQELITPRTALVSLSMANGLTGVLQPFEEAGKIAQEKGVLVHLDASWLLGKMPLLFSELAADYLTFSGDPIHSVQGTGAVFARKEAPLLPLIAGAKQNIPALSALRAALRLGSFALDAMGLEVARLRNLLEEKLREKIPDMQILFSSMCRLPNTTALLFPCVHSETLAYFLKRRGVYPNESGLYMQKLPKILAFSQIETESALSFSLSRMTQEEELLQGIEIIAETVDRLKTFSEGLFLCKS